MSEELTLTRRGLFAGAGAAVAATTLGASGALGATGGDDSVTDGQLARAVPPNVAPIGTPLRHGVTYRYRSMFDVAPENHLAEVRWGGYGVYGTAAGILWASVDLPAGARLREIEWYGRNTGADNVPLYGRLAVAGVGDLTRTIADGILAPGTGTQTVTVSVPTETDGPYPSGSRLYLGFRSRANDSSQFNGARVGLIGGGQLSLLPSPVRAYDSRKSGSKKPLGKGKTRTVALPAALIPPGTSGVVVNVTAVQTAAQGQLTIFRGDGTRPKLSTLTFRKDKVPVSNAATVSLPVNRRIKVWVSQKAHFVIDVVGIVG